jgi:hypothetical protein
MRTIGVNAHSCGETQDTLKKYTRPLIRERMSIKSHIRLLHHPSHTNGNHHQKQPQIMVPQLRCDVCRMVRIWNPHCLSVCVWVYMSVCLYVFLSVYPSWCRTRWCDGVPTQEKQSRDPGFMRERNKNATHKTYIPHPTHSLSFTTQYSIVGAGERERDKATIRMSYHQYPWWFALLCCFVASSTSTRGGGGVLGFVLPPQTLLQQQQQQQRLQQHGPFSSCDSKTHPPSGRRCLFRHSPPPLTMVPRFDPTVQKFVPMDLEQEGPAAGYPPIGTLLRQGPQPYFQRVFNTEDYEQAVLKFMAVEQCSRNEAQGNMDAYLRYDCNCLYVCTSVLH